MTTRHARYRSENPHMYLYHTTKSRAKRRGLTFDIDAAFVKKLLEPMTCSVTGMKLCHKDHHDPKDIRKYNIPSIDRIDNTKGYTKDNIRVVSWWYNRSRSEMDDGDNIKLILEIADGIREKNGDNE